MARGKIEILAAIAFIILIVYLNNKEEINYSISRFFSGLFAIITRGIIKRAGR